MTDIYQAYKLFHEGTLALAEIERQGMVIDYAYIANKKKEIDNQVTDLENEFYGTKFYKDWKKAVKTIINIYSHTQLSKYLYETKRIKIKKQTNTGKGATDEEALSVLNIPELDILSRIMKLKKIRDTYLDSFEREQVNGVMHPFFNLNLVRSYRSSSSNPNFQNIPRRDKESMNICRQAIYPRKGNQLVEFDFKQLEVRIAACYTKDEKLIYDILHGDMHRDMAIEIFKLNKYNENDASHKILRNATKNGFIFPEFYGDYYKNCAVNLACNWGKLPKETKWKKGQGIEFENKHLADHLIAKGFNDIEDFTEHIHDIEDVFWLKRYKKYSMWKTKQWKNYQDNGIIETFTGFMYQGVMRKNDALNYPFQGSAFHCLLWSLIEINKAKKSENWNSAIIGQIHDSIVMDIDPDELKHVVEVVRCIMCHDIRKVWDWIIIPLDIDIEVCQVNKSWVEKQKYIE